MIRVLVVEHFLLVRSGIKRSLEELSDIEVVGEAGTSEQAIGMARQLQPDIVLLGINIPGLGGLETIRRLIRLNETLRVIVLSTHIDGPYPARALDLGAMGYLGKRCDDTELVTAVRRVAQGRAYIGAEVAQTMVLNHLDPEDMPITTLSARELSVMIMVSEGLDRAAISDKLSVSPKTVSTYRSRLLRKLGVNSDVHLTHICFQHGLIDIPSVA